MKWYHFKRLEKLASFLDQLPPQKFNFNKIAHEVDKPMLEALKAKKESCGTVGCAMGWTPAIFPKFVQWVHSPDEFFGNLKLKSCATASQHIWNIAHELFDVDYGEAKYLFQANASDYTGHYNNLSGSATPKEVAKNIRRFIKRKKAKQANA